jgi:protein phosphatase
MPEFTLHSSAATHVGLVRRNNEDAIATSGTSDFPLTEWNGALSPTDGWALVADGMGGHAAGEVASQLAVELLRPFLSSLKNASDIKLALEATNDALFDTMAGNPSLVGMGTTVTGVLFRGDRALVFNVGDSRAYLHQYGVLIQVSVDDVVGGYQLTQCLGGFDRQAQINPHVRLLALRPGASLLLCTDGLTDLLTDDQIVAMLDQHVDASTTRLVSAALQAGGHDNVSAVLIEIVEVSYGRR